MTKEFSESLYHFITVLSFFVFMIALKFYELWFQIVWFSEKEHFEVRTFRYETGVSDHLWIKIGTINNCNLVSEIKLLFLVLLIDFIDEISGQNFVQLLKIKLLVAFDLLHVVIIWRHLRLSCNRLLIVHGVCKLLLLCLLQLPLIWRFRCYLIEELCAPARWRKARWCWWQTFCFVERRIVALCLVLRPFATNNRDKVLSVWSMLLSGFLPFFHSFEGAEYSWLVRLEVDAWLDVQVICVFCFDSARFWHHVFVVKLLSERWQVLQLPL